MIQLINKTTQLAFTEQDEDLLCAFAGQIGMCIEHVTNAQQLTRHVGTLREGMATLDVLVKRLTMCGALPSTDDARRRTHQN